MRPLVAALALAALLAGCSPTTPPVAAAPAAPPPAAGKDVTIGVAPDGTYTVNGKPTGAKDLEGALREAERQTGATPKAGGAK